MKNTPSVIYRDLELEQQIGLDWEQYNSLSILESGKFGWNNPDTIKYINEVRKRERLNIGANVDLKQAVKEINDGKKLAKQTELKSRHELTCKNCGSHDFQLSGDNSKKYSFGKSVAGSVGLGLMTGGLGFIAGGAVGFAGKKGKKNTFVCMNCGKTVEVKK